VTGKAKTPIEDNGTNRVAWRHLGFLRERRVIGWVQQPDGSIVSVASITKPNRVGHRAIKAAQSPASALANRHANAMAAMKFPLPPGGQASAGESDSRKEGPSWLDMSLIRASLCWIVKGSGQ
jgi:hypothetical protein